MARWGQREPRPGDSGGGPERVCSCVCAQACTGTGTLEPCLAKTSHSPLVSAISSLMAHLNSSGKRGGRRAEGALGSQKTGSSGATPHGGQASPEPPRSRLAAGDLPRAGLQPLHPRPTQGPLPRSPATHKALEAWAMARLPGPPPRPSSLSPARPAALACPWPSGFKPRILSAQSPTDHPCGGLSGRTALCKSHLVTRPRCPCQCLSAPAPRALPQAPGLPSTSPAHLALPLGTRSFSPRESDVGLLIRSTTIKQA